jgi:glycosyltransferase involved in cell wall biosynthesis
MADQAHRNGRPAAFIAWTHVEGRAAEVAQALGLVEQRYFWPPVRQLPLVPLRYLASAIRTVGFILRRRPVGVIVQNPPLPAALVGFAAARIAGARVVLDSHTAAFLRTGPRRWLPDRVNAWLAGRVEGVMVTVPEIGDRVRASGGRPIILHEAPSLVEATPPPDLGERPRVLVVSVFAPDEPVWEVIEAARLVPEADFVITGSEDKRPPGLAEQAPDNVTFPGFLPLPRYHEALAEAHVVMTLDTRPEAVSRSAYDAVWARRPLVLSGGPQMRELFPYAVAVENEAASIADGVRTAIDRYPDLARDTAAALPLQRERWERQSSELLSALTGR